MGKTVRQHDVLVSATSDDLPHAVARALAASTRDEVGPGEAGTDAANAILSKNGDWDAGASALAHPNAAGVPVWYLRGEPASGGLISDAVVPELARRVGADHVLTMAGASHSPMRSRNPESMAFAILTAMDAQSDVMAAT